MSKFKIDQNQIIPGNSGIDDCPAPGKYGEFQVEISGEVLSQYETPPRYRGYKVLGVLGPIACDICQHQCTDAYIPITLRFMLEATQRLPDVSVSPTPVYISRFDYTDSGVISDTTAPALDKIAPGLASLNTSSLPRRLEERGSDEVAYPNEADRSIIDDIYELQRILLLTMLSDGSIYTHKDGLQLELDLPTMSSSPSDQTGTDPSQEMGQQKLF